MGKSRILRSCTYITSFLSAVHGFSFTLGNNPTQCDSLAISWTGGQAPFQILVTPVYHPLLNIPVPSSAFSNNKGSYSISQFPFTAGTQLLLTMSDATAFGSGGTTNVLTVGASVSNNNCNTTLWQAFSFSTSPSIQQCNGYTFSDYGGAQLPVTITGLIPSGEPVVLPPVTSSSYTWVANVKGGTDLLFFMTDSNSQQGGVDVLKTVGGSTDSSCLSVNSPSSTSSAPSQTSSQSTSSGTGSKTPSVAVIAGASAGGGVLLALLVVLAVRCSRRASRSSHVTFPPESQSRRLQRKDDGREVIHQTGGISDPPPMRPVSQSWPANSPATDPVRQHIRQISYTDSFGGGSSLSFDGRQMAATGGQTRSPNTYPHQTLPAGLSPPSHPGAHSHLMDAPASNSINNPHAPFNQMRPSHISSTIDAFAGYGDAGNGPIPPDGRQIPAMTGQAALPNQLPYQRRHVGHPPPSNQPRALSQHPSASSFIVSDHTSSLTQTRASRMSRDMDGFARHASAGSSSVSSISRQMPAQAALPNPFSYQTAPVHFAPSDRPGTLSHHTSFGSSTVSHRASTLNPTQSLRLSSNMDGVARDVGAGSSSSGGQVATAATNSPARIIKHTDIEDVPAASDSQEVIEFPPDYVERVPIPSEPAPASDPKTLQS